MHIKKVLLPIAISLTLALGLWAQDTRPVRDDIGFCWKVPEINRLMEFLKSVSPEDNAESLPSLIAGISPHDDYLYAGKVYYQLYKHIKTKEVVIFGVTHRAPRLKAGDPIGKLILDSYENWIGPFGKVKISPLREYLKTKITDGSIIINNEAHRLEHSIEAEIPFLQYYNRNIQITPIMVTGMDFNAMKSLSSQLAIAITSYIKEKNLKIGEDIFFLMSADGNHYGLDFDNIPYGEDEHAHELANKRDKTIADSYLSGDMSEEKINGLTSQLWGKTFKDYNDTVWCGKYSIPFGMLTVMNVLNGLGINNPLEGKILLYTDTYSEGVLPLKKPGFGITAPFSLKHWVGFLSAAYYLKK